MNSLTLSLKSVRRLAWLLLTLLPASIALAAPVADISRTTRYVTVANAQAPAKTAANGMGIDNGAIVTTGRDGQAVIKFRDAQTVALLAENVTTVTRVISDAELPPGLFSELEGMSLTGGLSGPESGVAGPAGPMIGPVPAWALGLGVGAAAIRVMVADENQDRRTTHH